MRPITMDRENWLFAASKRFCKRTAITPNLLATADRDASGQEPRLWLSFVDLSTGHR